MVGQGLAHPHGLASLARRTVGDVGGGFDLAAGILDRTDQAGGGVRRLAHRHGRLLGRGRNLGRLAQHPARKGRGPLP